MATKPPVKDFVTDAFAHAKFIGWAEGAKQLLEAAGLADQLDEGCIFLDSANAITEFLNAAKALRHWPREAKMM